MAENLRNHPLSQGAAETCHGHAYKQADQNNEALAQESVKLSEKKATRDSTDLATKEDGKTGENALGSCLPECHKMLEEPNTQVCNGAGS